jgi:Phosphoribosyl-ATP pyrophosphohydrolase
LIAETADLIYHLLVVLAARGITLAEVEAELAERTRQSGLQEKASRKDGRKPAPAAVRKVKTRPRPAKARDKGRMSKGA